MTRMAEFDQVQSVTMVTSLAGSHLLAGSQSATQQRLQVKIAGTIEPLTISCPTEAMTVNVASLIDGYCRLITGSQVWNYRGRPLLFILMRNC